jgi:hypothetical protein
VKHAAAQEFLGGGLRLRNTTVLERSVCMKRAMAQRRAMGQEGKSIAVAAVTPGPLRQLIDLIAARIARELIEEAQKSAKASKNPPARKE